MRVIGVLDLRGGLAVHARGGQRATYAPVCTVAGSSIEPGDALALAHAYIERLGITEIYVADLDAIVHHAPQDALIRAVSQLGVPCWLDAGVTSLDEARHALSLGASHVIVGLETLPSFEALASICDAVGGERVAFSLDLREGEPVTTAAMLAKERPEDLAASAVRAGASAVIVLDLLRVGSQQGIDLDLMTRVRNRLPGVTLLAGGGVRGLDDLVALQRAGCDGALVATALIEGQLNP